MLWYIFLNIQSGKVISTNPAWAQMPGRQKFPLFYIQSAETNLFRCTQWPKRQTIFPDLCAHTSTANEKKKIQKNEIKKHV